MSARARFEANLDVIDRAIARVCREGNLRGADADDFASTVKVALLSNDCAIVEKFEERSSFATYITIVIRRMRAGLRRADGRWNPSADARRGGEAAVLLERLLWRDRREREEALSIAAAEHPQLTRAQLEAIADGLAERAPQPRLVALDAEYELAATTVADERAVASEIRQRSAYTSSVMREAMETLSAEDRVILELRFALNRPIADIARALGLEQRPLYRRIETLLGRLRQALRKAGVDASSVSDLIGAAETELDFGLADGKSGEAHPS
ncbi:MAG TPA: sigma-70 family RNA polymerase sigma factor [Thermoanaerobaculia bacterium]